MLAVSAGMQQKAQKKVHGEGKFFPSARPGEQVLLNRYIQLRGAVGDGEGDCRIVMVKEQGDAVKKAHGKILASADTTHGYLCRRCVDCVCCYIHGPLKREILFYPVNPVVRLPV